MAKKECWLCHDITTTLYKGAPGVEGTFDDVCLVCAVESVYGYDGKSVEQANALTTAQMRKVVAGAGLVAYG